MHFLSDDDMKELLPAEEAALATPVPTQVVSSEEYLPPPQTPEQKEFEVRLLGMAVRLARKQSLLCVCLLKKQVRSHTRYLAVCTEY